MGLGSTARLWGGPGTSSALGRSTRAGSAKPSEQLERPQPLTYRPAWSIVIIPSGNSTSRAGNQIRSTAVSASASASAYPVATGYAKPGSFSSGMVRLRVVPARPQHPRDNGDASRASHGNQCHGNRQPGTACPERSLGKVPLSRSGTCSASGARGERLSQEIGPIKRRRRQTVTVSRASSTDDLDVVGAGFSHPSPNCPKHESPHCAQYPTDEHRQRRIRPPPAPGPSPAKMANQISDVRQETPHGRKETWSDCTLARSGWSCWAGRRKNSGGVQQNL